MKRLPLSTNRSGLAFPDLGDIRWHESAKCQNTPERLWFTSSRGDIDPLDERAAKLICSRCPVQARCLEWALEIDDRHALLGGTTPDERKKMKRKSRRAS